MKRSSFLATIAGVLTAPFVKKKKPKTEISLHKEQEITVQEYNGTHWVNKWSFTVRGEDLMLKNPIIRRKV